MNIDQSAIHLRHKEIKNIVCNILAPACREVKPEYILAVGRGGLVPGVMLSHETGIELEPMMWQSRTTDGVKTYIGVVDEALYEGRNIVVIDDINDTGATFMEILQEYDPKGKYEKQITTMCLIEKINSNYRCNVSGLRIHSDQWIYFPWES